MNAEDAQDSLDCCRTLSSYDCEFDSPQVVLNEDEKVFLFPWIKLASVDPTKKSKGEGK